MHMYYLLTIVNNFLGFRTFKDINKMIDGKIIGPPAASAQLPNCLKDGSDLTSDIHFLIGFLFKESDVRKIYILF